MATITELNILRKAIRNNNIKKPFHLTTEKDKKNEPDAFIGYIILGLMILVGQVFVVAMGMLAYRAAGCG